MVQEVGRPTKLNDELLLKIKDLVLEGKELPEIAELLNIPYKTLESWQYRNFQCFSDKYDGYKRDWRLKQALENIDQILSMETTNSGITKNGETFHYKDPRLIKFKLNASLFVAETLGKKYYSRRSEISGNNGEPIETMVIYLPKKDNN